MTRTIGYAALAAVLAFPLAAQDRDWHDRDHRMTRIEAGTVIPVRVNRTIDTNRPYEQSNEMYTGTVDRDVVGENGRVAIPRGAQVDLRVRVAHDNDLVVDIDSVRVRDREFSLPVHPDRMPPQNNGGVVGDIIGAVTGQQVHGPVVRIERGTVLTFRMTQPLELRALHGG